MTRARGSAIGKRGPKLPARPRARRAPRGGDLRVEVSLAGDRRAAEAVILEVLRLSRRFGFEEPRIEVATRAPASPRRRARAGP